MIKKIVHEHLDRFLPFDAIRQGFGLDWWAPELFEKDPVILTRYNKEIYRWDYIPSLGEVFEKCREIMEADNGQS